MFGAPTALWSQLSVPGRLRPRPWIPSCRSENLRPFPVAVQQQQQNLRRPQQQSPQLVLCGRVQRKLSPDFPKQAFLSLCCGHAEEESDGRAHSVHRDTRRSATAVFLRRSVIPASGKKARKLTGTPSLTRTRNRKNNTGSEFSF